MLALHQGQLAVLAKANIDTPIEGMAAPGRPVVLDIETLVPVVVRDESLEGAPIDAAEGVAVPQLNRFTVPTSSTNLH